MLRSQVESFKALGYDEQAISEPVTYTLAFWRLLTFRKRHGWSWTDETTQLELSNVWAIPTHSNHGAMNCIDLPPCMRHLWQMTASSFGPPPSANTTAAKEQQPDQETEGVHKAGRGSWVDRVLPTAVRPYAHLMRLDKPIGNVAAGVALLLVNGGGGSHGQHPEPVHAGGVHERRCTLRGAGCTINDIWDWKLDRQVERTHSCPLAA
eukprot:jgi/Botrbrau1/3259/Bobra.174_1s0030.1